MIRVLEVVEATVGGVKQHLLSVLPRLDPARFHVTVVCPPVRACAYGDTSFVDEARQAGLTVYPVPMTREPAPGADWQAIRAVRRLLRDQSFDLVHAHSSKAGLVGRVAARWAGVPAIYSPHAFFFLGDHAPAKRGFYVVVEWCLGRLGGTLLCVSEAERQSAIRYRLAPASRTVVIENGIEPGDFATPPASLDLGLPPGPLVVFVGRLCAQKNVGDLLDALAIVRTSVPDARLLLVGEGEEHDALADRAARLGLGPAVTFLGYRTDARQIMAQADVLVLTAHYEAGVPYVVLEALAWGRPVMAYDLPELHGIAGVSELVPPQPAALAGALATLLQDRARAQALGQAGRQRVFERFSLAQQVQRVESLYETAAGSRA
ncbi:MAG: glycosyltransferase family 4 protein [Chloroflexi bacterium]|nr:glycosyltransferase family 4 protein [Chloroflexota bacterium]MBU1750017.1 glycosyltransferase family 4 protein [Chloroflexota bacterium]MBU1880127.1 glycosyltransferase family 4 protein [Chloroflexota bacterium]